MFYKHHARLFHENVFVIKVCEKLRKTFET